jgi:hypothetical protein
MTLGTQTLGGGSSAVAASAHAACARFRGTDPLVTRLTRRKLAEAVGHPDAAGGIPEARWMRAMTFERLVRDVKFASEVATTAVGQLGLDRPTEVVIVNANVNIERTAALLGEAHARAVADRSATLIHGLAVPFVGFEESRATDVKPDFAVVAPKTEAQGPGSWLVVGDAKDYERLRSRIEDARLLKGFLQVAVGAESCAAWSRLPADMQVHEFGVLAVPRNAFLQPQALVEDLADHRSEVRMRITERRAEAARHPYDPATPIRDFVAHLHATFDPASCTTCTLFAYCRDELRRSDDPADLLVELGITPDMRPHVIGLVDGSGELGAAPASIVAMITATVSGSGQYTGQKRIDPAGVPGTVNVVIAKSDAAALGVHGMAIQRVSGDGPGDWAVAVYDNPQSPVTRQAVMKALGKELGNAMAEMRRENKDAPAPIHLVVPDRATADVLVSIADNMAGIELSRLRWQRDRAMRRPALTFNGEPATIPSPLRESDRTAVSFLLEDDRARALTVRSPIVDLRDALARHLVAGGPAADSLRLDYLVAWADLEIKVERRGLADAIEASGHTPGARMTNAMSDQIHKALTGGPKRSGGSGPADPDAYRSLVESELGYKCGIFDQALDALEQVEDSMLRLAHRAIEGDAQAVWRRRLAFHASDLVRFGRTYRWWRNSQVPSIESDAKCRDQLQALVNPRAAHDLATSAGTRGVAFATVVSADPIVLEVQSRRIGDGDRIVLLHVNDRPCVESDSIAVDTSPAGSVKIDGLSIGPLSRHGIPMSDPAGRLRWLPPVTPALLPGDRLIVGAYAWFWHSQGNRFLNVGRPTPDQSSAPRASCTPTSYEEEPTKHQYCCRPHEVAEAEWSDELATRRERGELNPERWPPVRDADAFEVAANGAPEGDPTALPSEPAPDSVTIDDID